MCDSKNILILGGDERQKQLYSIIKETENTCKHVYDMIQTTELNESIDSANIIILPLPITKNGTDIYSDSNDFKIPLEDIFERIRPSQLVIGGLIKNQVADKLKEKNVDFFDFYKDEGLTTYNAFLTAQGAVYLMLENTDEYVVSKKILVTGFGRVGKAVAHFMHVMGLDVYVAVRSEPQKCEAASYGYKILDISDIKSTVYLFDFIVNTVPAIIFDENTISLIKKDSVYIELASSPFGAEKDYFEKSEKRYILAASLPGRLYPSASAKAIYRSIEKYL
ncbi:MAG: hypothetical protein NC122_08405 [Faecalibacterium sp.]|nr:hypothetical protein [Ruminococcus sp.]MCM1391660.1 hypothetical protein [Ruminococcus sp.]MCM1486215.1 hypothetical protein [Faecalibacterium sp.]